jgi:hypothetical protein
MFQKPTMSEVLERSDRGGLESDGLHVWRRISLVLLICFFILVCCVSLRLSYPFYREAYIIYDETRLYYAIAAVAAFASISPLFAFGRFSFGYFVGFYSFTMVAGYLWLNSFSQFQYNHVAAGFSAAISLFVFLLPALLITSPVKQLYVISDRTFERLPTLITLFCGITAAIAAGYNFKIVSLDNMYELRAQLQFPTLLNYAIEATTSVLVPFAFACFVARRKYWQAGVAILIALSFYPITLTKVALFTPAWLVTLTLLSRFFEARVTVVLSLLLPVLLGVILIVVFGETARGYFNIVNMRMIAVPSNAMDVYNEYFARHQLTHFCQIWLLKPFVSCALEYPLAVEMQNNYVLGNFNASLFATEGIASVGLLWAPIAVFGCGLVIALGNRLSADLPPRFVLISGAILPQIFLNVPMTTVWLTHGLWLLFLLWHVTPRTNLFKE